jgi:hypothetical protein
MFLMFKVSEHSCITTLVLFLATQNGNLGSEKFGRLGKIVFDRAYRLVGLHRLHLVLMVGLFVYPRGYRLALYRIGNLATELLFLTCCDIISCFQHHYCCTILCFITCFPWARLLVGPAMTCPDASPGWLLIDLLEDGSLELGLWRRSYTHHRPYEDLLQRTTEARKT